MADGVQGDIKAHETTYGSFLTLLKFGGIATFVIAAIVVVIIGS